MVSDKETIIRNHLEGMISIEENKKDKGQLSFILKTFNELTGYNVLGLKGKIIRDLTVMGEETEIVKIAKAIWKERDILKPEYKDFDFEMLLGFVRYRLKLLKELGENDEKRK